MPGISTCVRCGFVTVLHDVQLRQLLPDRPMPRDLVTIISCAPCEPRCAAYCDGRTDNWRRALQAELLRGGARLTTAAAAAVELLGDPLIAWPPPVPGVQPIRHAMDGDAASDHSVGQAQVNMLGALYEIPSEELPSLSVATIAPAIGAAGMPAPPSLNDWLWLPSGTAAAEAAARLAAEPESGANRTTTRGMDEPASALADASPMRPRAAPEPAAVAGAPTAAVLRRSGREGVDPFSSSSLSGVGGRGGAGLAVEGGFPPGPAGGGAAGSGVDGGPSAKEGSTETPSPARRGSQTSQSSGGSTAVGETTKRPRGGVTCGGGSSAGRGGAAGRHGAGPNAAVSGAGAADGSCGSGSGSGNGSGSGSGSGGGDANATTASGGAPRAEPPTSHGVGEPGHGVGESLEGIGIVDHDLDPEIAAQSAEAGGGDARVGGGGSRSSSEAGSGGAHGHCSQDEPPHGHQSQGYHESQGHHQSPSEDAASHVSHASHAAAAVVAASGGAMSSRNRTAGGARPASSAPPSRASSLLSAAVCALREARWNERAMEGAEWSWTYGRVQALRGARASGARTAAGGALAALLQGEAAVRIGRKRRRRRQAPVIEGSDGERGGEGAKHGARGAPAGEPGVAEEWVGPDVELRALLGRIGDEMQGLCAQLLQALTAPEEPPTGEAWPHAAEWCDLRGVLAASHRGGALGRAQQRQADPAPGHGRGASCSSRAESRAAALAAKFSLWGQLGRALARHCGALSGV